MTQRRRFSAEYKREAVAMVQSPGARGRQVALELGIEANALGCWRRELRQELSRRLWAMAGHVMGNWPTCVGRWPASPRSGIFCEKRQRASRACRDEVSDDPTMPHRVSHPDDAPVFAGLAQWVLRLGHAAAAWAGSGERPVTGADSSAAAEHDDVVGSPRIWEDLRYAGERCGCHRVARLMCRAGLQGAPQRRQWRKKPSRGRPDGTRNHLNRDFRAAAPNTKWVTDSTYIRAAEHWLYLCIVLDVYSGLVVGWSMSPHQDHQLVVQERERLVTQPSMISG